MVQQKKMFKNSIELAIQVIVDLIYKYTMEFNLRNIIECNLLITFSQWNN